MSKITSISEELLGDGIHVRIKTCGSSMFPLIGTGDRITISHDTNPDIGDIIVFKRNDGMVCHRVVKVFERDGNRYYQTRGDSFFSLDEPVISNQMLGKVIRIERENVSFARRVLLLINPVMRRGRLNAAVILVLIKIKTIFF